jgi:hypothetical protein
MTLLCSLHSSYLLLRDRHFCLLFWTLALVAVAILKIIGIIGGIIFIIVYSFLAAAYLVVALKSNTFQYLRNIYTTETVLAFMDRMYATEPHINWFIQCYHYETRRRQVSYSDSEGRTQYRTETYQERVNTHSASGQLIYTRWEDTSTPLNRSEIEKFLMTKVSVKKVWHGDIGAIAQKEEFIRSNNRDVFYDFSENFVLRGFRPRFLGLTDLDKKPKLAHWTWYILSHLLVIFAVPYRMWLSSNTGKARTTIMKVIYTS